MAARIEHQAAPANPRCRRWTSARIFRKRLVVHTRRLGGLTHACARLVAASANRTLVSETFFVLACRDDDGPLARPLAASHLIHRRGRVLWYVRRQTKHTRVLNFKRASQHAAAARLPAGAHEARDVGIDGEQHRVRAVSRLTI